MGLARRGEERHWMPVLPIIRLLGARVRTRDAFVLVKHLHLTVVVHTILLHRSNFLRRTDGRTDGILSSSSRGWKKSYAAFVLSRAHVNIHSSAASIPRTLQLHSPPTPPRFSLTQFDCFFFFRFPAFTTVLWRITGGKIPRERMHGTI